MNTSRPGGLYVVIVTGSRDYPPRRYPIVRRVLADHLEPITGPVLIRHGGARGLDRLAARAATSLGHAVQSHPAAWTHCGPGCPNDGGIHRARNTHGTYCPFAGHRRNAAMIALGADHVIGFPLTGSRGTWHCLGLAHDAGLPYTVISPDGSPMPADGRPNPDGAA